MRIRLEAARGRLLILFLDNTQLAYYNVKGGVRRLTGVEMIKMLKKKGFKIIKISKMDFDRSQTAYFTGSVRLQ